MPNSLKCRLKNLVRNGLLRERDLERIVIIPEGTTEETIEILQELWRYKKTDKYTESEIRQALEMAIKALENKPRFILHSDGKIEQIIEPCDVVLDKIKDEIFDIDDETVLNPDSFYERKVYVRRSEVINIIDKYKTESEAADL